MTTYETPKGTVTVMSHKTYMKNKMERHHDKTLLKKFMQDHFDFKGLLKAGFFTKEMKTDYDAQADRVCEFFGYETVYEYGAKEMRGHLSYAEGHRPEGEPFVTIFKSYLYD